MQAPEIPKQCCQSGEWLQKVWSHYTSTKRSSLAAHREKDLVQDSAFDFQMHERMRPSLVEGIVSQTSQYTDTKIKH